MVILLNVPMSERSAQLYATVFMAPILFVFSEVIPKNLYYYRADVLMPRFAVILWIFHKIFTWSGAVTLLKTMSRLFIRMVGSSADGPAAITATGPNLIKQIIRETHDEGILSPVQNDIMNRLINIPNITVNSVMVPVNMTQMLDLRSDRATVLEILRKYHYTRFPVYKKRLNNVIGFVNIYEVLCSGGEFNDLKNFVKPIGRFNAACSVIDAIGRMQKHNHKIVLVTPAYSRSQKTLGIVTMKDLVEEFTGELSQW
jgi:CBS domain containing-hemolysin-like protein